MPGLTFKNFAAADRKKNLARFALFRGDQDLSWIDTAPLDPQQIVTVAYSATPVFDATKGSVLAMTLTGNVTSSTLTYGSVPPTGQQVYLKIVQDGVGSRTFALPTTVLVNAGFAIDSRANYASILPLEWNGSAWEFFAPPFSFDTTGTGAGKTLLVALTSGIQIQVATVTGSIDGENAAFTLSPAPTTGQLVHVNGVYQHPTVHYTMAGSTLTFLPAYIPQTGASIYVLVW